MKDYSLLMAGVERATTPEQTPRQRLLARLAVALVALAFVLGFIAIAGLTLWRTWQTSDWYLFWFATVISPLFLALPLAVALALRGRLNRLAVSAAVLREAAVSADERLAPPAAQQPRPEEAERLIGDLPFAPLRRAESLQSSRLAPLVALTLLLLFVFVPILFSGLLRGTAATSSAASLIAILPVLMTYLLFPAILLLLRWQSRRAFTVVADGDALVWRRGWGRRHMLPLQRVRAFFKVTPTVPSLVPSLSLQPLAFLPRTTYVVDTPEGALAWADPLDADDDEFEASERLSHFIVARTGLPLRDLSALAVELAQSAGNIKRALSAHIPTGGEGSASPVIAHMMARAAEMRQEGRRRRRQGWIAVLGVAILFIALYGTGGGLEYYQDRYVATLAHTVDAQTPIYHDGLAGADGTWPTLTPVPPGAPIEFRDGAYHVSGLSGQIAYAWPAQVFGDAAVEVTAHETGKKPDGRADGVGLIVRARARPADMVVFFISIDSRWRLYHYTPDASPANPWHYLSGGTSSSIHTDDGAPNRLLVITRGRLYLCYINGQYVGSYFDEEGATPGSGSAGVFNNDGGTDAAFNDFKVFPVRPFSSLLFV